MRINEVEDRHQARGDDADIRDTLRPGRWCEHQGCDFRGNEQAKGRADGLRWEIKRTDTYPDLCYLATGLWTYIITTGLPTGLTKGITVG